MDLPALLPNELKYTSVAENDRNRFNMLIKIPQDFVLFFEYASDDETWSGYHEVFMKESIQWMTNQFFQDKLEVGIAQRAVAKIREHHYILSPLVDNNLTIFISDSDSGYDASSLLWGASSESLKNLIRQECRDKNAKSLRFENVTPQVFSQLDEYIKTGNVKDLSTKSQEEVTALLYAASEWGLVELMELAQDILKKYITRANVIEMLLNAHEEGWIHLNDLCIEFINGLDIGVRFEKSKPEYLIMEFTDFRPRALEIFELVRSAITHLIIGGDFTDNTVFSDVINRCPNLLCLDISNSKSFTDRLLDIPKNLEELDVSKCEWVNNKTLKKLIEICPNLNRLRLASNSHLAYSVWSILKDFKRLEKLDISRCAQIKDGDFKILLQACRQVTHFYLEECTGLSDNAFFELGKNIPRLTDLDVSKTNITDSGLIDLMMRCRNVIFLKIARCPNITEKGLLEAVRNAPKLKILDVTKASITRSTIQSLQGTRPYVDVIF
jgi:F-box/leucine-rich repeat protein 2/20